MTSEMERTFSSGSPCPCMKSSCKKDLKNVVKTSIFLQNIMIVVKFLMENFLCQKNFTCCCWHEIALLLCGYF